MKLLFLIFFLLIVGSAFGQATKATYGNIEVRNYSNVTKASIDTNGVVMSTSYKNKGVVSITGADINWSLGNSFTDTLSAPVTYTISFATPGSITVMISNQTGTSITWPSSIKWKDDFVPVPTIGKTDIYTFIYASSTRIYGICAQNFPN